MNHIHNLFHGSYTEITEFNDIYSGDTTANNEHNCFFFSDNLEVAEDYGRQSIIRAYEDRDREELENYHDLEPCDIELILEDTEEYANNNLVVTEVSINFNNPFVIDLEGEKINCVRIQEIIGHLKGVSFDDETSQEIYNNIECECSEHDIGCYCELPEYDGLIINNCIDDIGYGSNQVQNEYVAFESNQISIVRSIKGEG